MALSSKVAALTCLAFVFGMCWLVSLVARPLVELPTPLLAREAHGASGRRELMSGANDTGVAGRPAAVDVAARFVRSSPVEADAGSGNRGEGALRIAEFPAVPADPTASAAPRTSLPPMLAASVEPAPPTAPLFSVAGSVETAPEPPIPEAVVSTLDLQGARSPVPASPDLDVREIAARAEMVSVAEADVPLGTMRRAMEYRVRRGDTVLKIMRRVWHSDDPQLLNTLLAANPHIAERRNRIFPGEVLTIPALASEQPAITTVALGPPERARSAFGADDSSAGIRPRWYVVRRQDTLMRIARRILGDARRWREIATMNELADANKIPVGMRLRLPPLLTDT